MDPQKYDIMSGIVADGRENLLVDPEVQRQIVEATGRVLERYRQEYEAAGWWGRFWLRRLIRRETAHEIEKIAPTRGLY